MLILKWDIRRGFVAFYRRSFLLAGTKTSPSGGGAKKEGLTPALVLERLQVHKKYTCVCVCSGVSRRERRAPDEL